VLDVPCTNSGVFARRPEARYRFSHTSVGQLAQLQRQVFRVARDLLAPGGHVLYATCSIEAAENAKQARKLARQIGGELLREHETLPGGDTTAYHDGGYFALVKTEASG